MHRLVRDLYKRFLFVLRDYPCVEFSTGENSLGRLRQRLKAAFLSNSHLSPVRDEEKFLRAIHHGRYELKEAIATIQLKKYRTLRKIYHQQENPQEEQRGTIKQQEKEEKR